MLNIENLPDSEETQDELEDVVMGLIINSGGARSLAYDALAKAKAGDFETATKLMADSRQSLNEAHMVQTRLIENDQGEGSNVSLVLVHAQDHLMTSMLARELVSELIELHRRLELKI
ncbi:PTS N,N'-diacetylchitobiose transporter subunit IIA [Vibrio mediterranei]|jgi:PTS system cellobiose-specific IIA component|uniref:PTS N,N'-diacetylchitobiose transporter subunit IIA n=1 Tax=Vibrio mediterranei TaxID=689 RepID=UPI001EFEE876|nr:PTS N,N'-diacetylchitobiose transporter subunit IIA [Vibrio mediterranei]MCG9629064.1 PTS N,N'-diacetylchitobiose transporter subunit IIA [Vibrio mediterranei]MCY9855375.1 PTS N,N'-diacetylchitobiose transporter subunit IIA [Vibrio mediterranei]